MGWRLLRNMDNMGCVVVVGGDRSATNVVNVVVVENVANVVTVVSVSATGLLG